MVHKVDAIRSLFKGQYNKATADNIEWIDGHTTTDTEKSQIDAELNKLQVIENRKAEYPSIEECVHAILDDNLVALQEKRNAVKLKYPKDNA